VHGSQSMVPHAITRPTFEADLRGDSSSAPQSGERPRFPRFRPDETLGAASYAVLSALGLDFVDDDTDAACRACATEPLRAAAWLRSRRAAVGHAVSEMRARGERGDAYAALSRTRSGPGAPCNLRFGIITSARLAAWVRPDRLAIVLVGVAWPTAVVGVPHALAVVGARDTRHLSVFDPAGAGHVEEVTTHCMDVVRAGPDTWAEVLCVGKRPAARLRLV